MEIHPPRVLAATWPGRLIGRPKKRRRKSCLCAAVSRRPLSFRRPEFSIKTHNETLDFCSERQLRPFCIRGPLSRFPYRNGLVIKNLTRLSLSLAWRHAPQTFVSSLKGDCLFVHRCCFNRSPWKRVRKVWPVAKKKPDWCKCDDDSRVTRTVTRDDQTALLFLFHYSFQCVSLSTSWSFQSPFRHWRLSHFVLFFMINLRVWKRQLEFGKDDMRK